MLHTYMAILVSIHPSVGFYTLLSESISVAVSVCCVGLWLQKHSATMSML